MKDYRLKKDEQSDYIIDIRPTKTSTVEADQSSVDTFEVVFADGKVFKNIVANEEQIAKVVKKQEEQAKAGVANLPVFEKRKTLAGIMTGAAIIGGPFIGTGAMSLLNMSEDPVKLSIGVGALTLGALVPGVYLLIKNTPIVRELRKIKYRDEHRTELDSFDSYENALVGIPAKVARRLETRAKNNEDPYCITYVDTYTQKDLETIVENIDREKAYQFTYAKRPTATAKK